MRRIFDYARGKQERYNPNGYVDIENPAPAIVIGNKTAESWANRRRHDDPHPIHRQSHAALLPRERRRQGRYSFAHCTQTFGSTDIPNRNRWSLFWPGSRTILTGTRCTTLT